MCEFAQQNILVDIKREVPVLNISKVLFLNIYYVITSVGFVKNNLSSNLSKVAIKRNIMDAIYVQNSLFVLSKFFYNF